MSKKYTGKELNGELIKQIREFIFANQAKGKTQEEMENDPQFFKTDYTNDDGTPAFVWNEIPGQLPPLVHYVNQLDKMLNFGGKEVDDTELYEIPNFVMNDPKDPNKKIEATIRIKKENAKELVSAAKNLKSQFGIELPQEIYQMAKENILPGFGYNAPEPKKVSETQEEYEARMEEHYKANGLEKEALEKYREAYPHEKIDYTKEPPIMTKQGRKSYQDQLNDKGLGPKVAEHGGKGMPASQKKRVVDTNPTLGQRIYSAYVEGRGIFNKKVLRNAVLTVGGVALGGAILSAAPVGVAMMAVPTAAFTAIGLTYLKYGKPWLKKIKGKVIDWFKGPKINEPEEKPKTPEQGKGKGKGEGPTPTPQPQPTPIKKGGNNGGNNGGNGSGTPTGTPTGSQDVEIPAELIDILQAIEPDNQTIKLLETKIKFAKENIDKIQKRLDAAEEKDKPAIKAELDAASKDLSELIQQEKAILTNVYQMIQEFVYGKKQEKGGPTV